MISQEIRKLLYKYFPATLPERKLIPEREVNEFIEELGTLVKSVIAKSTKDVYKESTLINVRDLEEILRHMRDYKDHLENKPEKTTQDILKIDELKQADYKLTEKILTNR